MRFMNEYDVESLMITTSPGETPVLRQAVQTLANLVEWTNSHSDGWAYWPKPARSAARLMELVEGATQTYGDVKDVDPKVLKAALSPVKAFLTRQGVAHSEVLA